MGFDDAFRDSALLGDDGQRSQHRQPQLVLDVGRSLDGAVETFEQQRHHDADEKSRDQGDQYGLALVRLVGTAGRHGRIDHAPHRALQLAAHVGFLEAPEEHVVHLAIARRLALEDAELEFLAIDLLDFALGLAHAAFNRDFIRPRHLVFLGDARDHGRDRLARILARGAQIGFRLQHTGMLLAVAAAEFGQLSFGLALDLAHLHHEQIVHHRRHRLVACIRPVADAADLVEFALGLGPALARIDQRPGGFFELAGDAALRQALGIDDARRFPILLQRFFRGFYFLTQPAQALGEPVARFLRHLVARFEVALDIGLGDRVGDPRREFRIVGLETHAHQLAQPHRLHREPALESTHHPLEDCLLALGFVLCFDHLIRQPALPEGFFLLARIELGVGGQLEFLHHAERQFARFQDFGLGLEEFAVGAAVAVHVFDRHHLVLVRLDQQGHGRTERRPDGEYDQRREERDGQRQADDAPLALVDGAPVFEQVERFLDVLFAQVGDVRVLGNRHRYGLYGHGVT